MTFTDPAVPLLQRDGGPFNPYYVYYGGNAQPEGVNGYRWWGDELEVYTTDSYTPAPFKSSVVANGVLSMIAQPKGTQYAGAPQPYMSSCLESSKGPFWDAPATRAGRPGHEQKYGYWEARMKVPRGKGLWPAFWLNGGVIYGQNNNKQGELDIFEMIGDGVIYQTAHDWWGTPVSESTPYNPGWDHSADYHTYGLSWTSTEIVWYVDGVETKRASATMVARYRDLCGPMFFVLNTSVGGAWPGSPDATTPWPAVMAVDYVRVYALP
ncbi:MAG: glycoside hydrolase family 16 protein [Ramlibacter sp.]